MERGGYHEGECARHPQLHQSTEQVARLRRPDNETAESERRVETEGLDDAVKEPFAIDADAACHLADEREFRGDERQQQRARRRVVENRLTVNEPPRREEEEHKQQLNLPQRRI